MSVEIVGAEVEASRKVRGAVLWFNDARGYGFVLYDETQHFVHYSQIDMDGFKSLEAGQIVSFVRKFGERGWLCENVEVV